jgi:dipeptidyl aminopeptidase/acylaminoacyl peptidase
VIDWQFGNSRYVLLSSTQALITPLINSIATPTLLDLETKKLTPVEPAPHVNLDSLFALSSTEVLFVGSTHDEPAALTVANLAKPKKASYTTIKPSAEVGENLKGMFASASGIELEVASGPLHILYFPPTNPKYTAPLASDGSVVPPPALFRAHGGPTSRSAPGHSWPAAYFTSRGYAVVDVNYAGSSGFGRAYRERLRGQWGVSDVADCASAVKGCVERGLVDATKVALSGGSAGVSAPRMK